MSVAELQKQHTEALNAAEAIVAAHEKLKAPLSSDAQQRMDGHLRKASDLQAKIAAAKPAPTRSIADASRNLAELRQQAGLPRRAVHNELNRGTGGEPIVPKRLSREYFEGFHAYLSGVGPLSAALYEGSNPVGGYAVPIIVNEQVVALAPQDSAVRKLATVVPTKSDIKTPQVTARGTVTAKSETSGFTVVAPTLGQFTLSAFAAGIEVQTSIELAQDVDLIKAFVYDDAVSAFLEYEEQLFLTGTGSGQPQGLIGNVGAGVTEEPDSNGNLVSIQGTLNILGQLKETYHAGASWLMQRATSLIIRKAQIGTNLFEPVFRRENGTDYLHGYPVAFSGQMPTAARNATPVLFGDFARGYIIGDRGGSALRVKVLDQANAANGLMDLLFFRRTDGRVSRSEAIQQYNVAAS